MGTLARALDTIPLLYAEIGRLRARLARTLADLHNLIAAARATLGAHADGEDDAAVLPAGRTRSPGPAPAPITGSGHDQPASRHRLRRRARQLRRDGFQPMMFLSPDEPLPETAGVIVVRARVAIPLRTRPVVAAAGHRPAAAALAPLRTPDGGRG